MAESEPDVSAEAAGGNPESTPAQPTSDEPAMGDIFNREDTKDELKIGVTLFALVGLGIGLGVLLADIFEEGVLGNGEAGIYLAPLLAIIIAQRISDGLADLPDNLALGTAATTALAGTIVLGLIAWIFNEITFDVTPDLGDFLLPLIGMAIGAAVVGAAMVWVDRNLLDE